MSGRFLPPGRFMVLISVWVWVDPSAIVRLEELGKLKKSTSSGTQTGNLPACSIVPQPTTLLRAPRSNLYPSSSTGLLHLICVKRCEVKLSLYLIKQGVCVWPLLIQMVGSIQRKFGIKNSFSHLLKYWL
jgi:hypothetical protein